MKNSTDNEMTLDEIAKIMGITKQRIRQIEQTALKKLKNPKFSAGPTKEKPGPILPTNAKEPDIEVIASYPLP